MPVAGPGEMLVDVLAAGLVDSRDILAELPGPAAEITRGTFAIDAAAVPLADAEKVWSDRDRRVVLVPGR